MEGLGGGGAGPWGGTGDGTIIVPQEGVASMQDNAAAPEPVEPDLSIGTGPILGLAPTEQTGQILEREVINQGLPVERQVIPAAEELPASAPESDTDQRVLGLSPLRLAQILLAVLAIITGLTAFLLRRRTAR